MIWHNWMMWLSVAVVFGVIEIATVNFYTIWLSISAILVMILSFFVPDLVVQIVVFAIVSLLLVLLSEKIIKKVIFNSKDNIPMNVDAMRGKHGIVISRIRNDRGEGVVKIGGVSWSARSVDGEEVPENTKIHVVRIEGVKAIVTLLNDDGDISGLVGRISTTDSRKVIESQTFKAGVEGDIDLLNIDLDNNLIDIARIEISEGDSTFIEYEVGLKSKSKGKEFELKTTRKQNELTITNVPDSIADGIHYNIALRIQTKPNTRIRANAIAGSFRIVSDWKANIDVSDLGDLDIELLNVDGDVKVRSTSGDVAIGDAKDIDIKSLAGDTAVGSCNSARLKTSSGDISIESIKEGIIHVSSGDLNVQTLEGNLNVNSKSGDISISNCCESCMVNIDAISGDIAISRFMSQSGKSKISTLSGDIAMTIDANSSISGICETTSGDIHIDGGAETTSITNQKKRLTIGDGASVLEIITTSGDVSIQVR